VAFYLPGVAPRNYAHGAKVELFVNAFSSPNTVVPYDFYDKRFHYCPPDNGPTAQPESLGSVLFGDRFMDSRFKVKKTVKL